MRPFDLYEALAGTPLCTRDHRPVLIWRRTGTFDSKFPLEGVITGTNDYTTWTLAGTFHLDESAHSPKDLFLATDD
jgi:hypothetical protein